MLRVTPVSDERATRHDDGRRLRRKTFSTLIAGLSLRRARPSRHSSAFFSKGRGPP
jgi:hypothetical protein